MNKKTLTLIVTIAVFSVFVFSGTTITAKAAPPIPPQAPQRTYFYVEFKLDEIIWIEIKLLPNNICVCKAYTRRTILEDSTIEGVMYTDMISVINLQTGEVHDSGGFEIITDDGTISGRMSGKYVMDTTISDVKGRFIGHGYMNIKGTVDIGETEEIAVFEGYSW